MRTVGLAAFLAAILSATSTHSEELFSYFTENDDPPETSLTISPCTGSEVAECISHSLSCEKGSEDGSPQLTVLVGDIEKIVSSLIVGTNGNAKARLKLANRTINLPVNSVRVYPNALEGGWTVTIGLGTIGDFFEVLTEKSSEGASLILAGEHFSLAPKKGDGGKLVAWKYACIALEGQSP